MGTCTLPSRASGGIAREEGAADTYLAHEGWVKSARYVPAWHGTHASSLAVGGTKYDPVGASGGRGVGWGGGGGGDGA